MRLSPNAEALLGWLAERPWLFEVGRSPMTIGTLAVAARPAAVGLLLLKRNALQSLATCAARRMPLAALRAVLGEGVDPAFFVETYLAREVAIVGDGRFAELRPMHVSQAWAWATRAPSFAPDCAGCRVHVACCAFVHAPPRIA